MAGVSYPRARRGIKPGTKMENTPNGMAIPSRPSSVCSSASSRASGVKKVKDKGPSKDELTKANTELSNEVEALNQENQLLKATISTVIETFIQNAKIKGIAVPSEINNPNVCEISADSLVSLTEKLTAESLKSNTMEFRVEELETRITHLNMELAKLLRTRVNVENGLDEIVNDCLSLDDVKQKARDLILDIKSSSLFTFLDSMPPDIEDEKQSVVLDVQSQDQSTISHKPHKTQSNTITVILHDQNLDLTPPSTKMAGDTHIKKMHKDLRQYVVQQLSMPKGNGADWRMMGERLGITSDTIQQWRRWKLEQPMQYVLQSWCQSPGATVRLLHRHLVSTQMRCTLLAKRISDFYKVD